MPRSASTYSLRIPQADVQEYRAGTLSTSQMKEACIAKIQEVVGAFQQRRQAVTSEMVKDYQDGSRAIDPSVAPRP